VTRPERPTLDTARAADFEESPLVKVTRLERTLADERRFAIKSTRQLHRALVRDLTTAQDKAAAAEARAQEAEKLLAAARKRARRAEAELAEIRSSATWKAGRVVLAVPGRLKRRGR